MSTNPHILVLMCDQMQANRMGFVDGIAHTPFLDQLANESIHFTNAFTCHGQCVPSRASFQTGQFPHECGVMAIYGFHGHQARLTDKHRILGQVFQQNGYRTAYFGKTHFGTPLSGLGYEVDGDSQPVSAEEAAAHQLEHVPRPLRPDYRSCDHAVEFLEQYQADGRPLFMTFSTNLPHPPFFAEPAWIDRFDPDEMPLPKSFYSETFADKPPFQAQHANDGRHGSLDEAAQRAELAQYYSMIAAMDDHFGRVAAQFKKLGLWDDTLVLVCADHGDMMGAHRMRLKGTLPYEELYRIPCLIKLPAGSPRPSPTVDHLVSSVQFPGTLLKAAGVAAPPPFNQRHFTHLLDGTPTEDEDAAVFFEHYAAYWGIHPFYAIRTRQHKYVRYYGDDNAEELYDLEADPDELHNRAADPQYKEVRTLLSRRADTWWQETGGRDLAYYESAAFKANRHNKIK